MISPGPRRIDTAREPVPVQYWGMAASSEQKALWFFAFVALSGGAVRLWKARTPAPQPAAVAALDAQVARVDSARVARKAAGPSNRRGRARAASPPVPAALVDIDRATIEELDALPGIGPALAHRIVADRDSAGAFGRIEALCDVRGIGPALTKRLRPLVTFSGAPRPLSAACDGGSSASPGSRGARTAGPR